MICDVNKQHYLKCHYKIHSIADSQLTDGPLNEIAKIMLIPYLSIVSDWLH